MQLSSNEEEELTTNEELRAAFYSLRGNKGWQHLAKNIEIWKQQCLNEILKEDSKAEKAKGEYTAYGRVLNSIDFFIQVLNGNPGEGPQLDPHAETKKK